MSHVSYVNHNIKAFFLTDSWMFLYIPVYIKVVGRLANYKYFNMDQSILNALELFDSNAPRAREL